MQGGGHQSSVVTLNCGDGDYSLESPRRLARTGQSSREKEAGQRQGSASTEDLLQDFGQTLLCTCMRKPTRGQGRICQKRVTKTIRRTCTRLRIVFILTYQSDKTWGTG